MGLDGWDKTKRIQFYIQAPQVASHNYPILFRISSNTGKNNEDLTYIFDQLSDTGSSFSSRKKVAFTQMFNGKEEQLFAELDTWNQVSKEAVFWVRPKELSLQYTNIFYFYFDKNNLDNTSYISTVGDSTLDESLTPSQEVWLNICDAVHHLNSDHGYKDSTINSLDVVSTNNVLSVETSLGNSGLKLSEVDSNIIIKNFPFNNVIIFGKFTGGSKLYWQDSLNLYYTSEQNYLLEISDITNTKLLQSEGIYTDGNLKLFYIGNDDSYGANSILNINNDFEIATDTEELVTGADDIIIGSTIVDSIQGIIEEIWFLENSITREEVSLINNNLRDNIITVTKHFIQGYTTLYNKGLSIRVVAYDRETYEIVGSTESAIEDGYYYMETTISTECFVVGLDVPLYNNKIIGNIFPTAL